MLLDRLLEQKPKKEGSLYSLYTFEPDIDIYTSVLAQSPVMQETVQKGMELLQSYPYLAQDVFISLYKYSPILRQAEDMHEACRLNHQIISSLMEEEEYKALHEKTSHDLVTAAMGAEVLQARILEQLEAMKERMNRQHQQNPDSMSGDELFNNLNAMLNGEKVPGMEDTLEQLEQMASSLKQVMTQALRETVKEVDDALTVAKKWGMEPGQMRNIPLSQKREAIERIRKSRKLRSLADVLGRMREVAHQTLKKSKATESSGIRSVTTGNQLENLLPTELATLRHPILKKEFQRKFLEKSLLVYEKQNRRQVGKGPIVVCCDVSGSMDGDPETYSKALALSLLEVAQAQKRSYAFISFNNTVQDVFEFPKGKVNLQHVVDLAERFSGGGTNFQEPLEKALEIMEQATFTRGDIIFITDGEAHLDEDFVKRFKALKAKKDFALYTMLIFSDSDEALRPISDEVLKIEDLLKQGEAAAKTIFSRVTQ